MNMAQVTLTINNQKYEISCDDGQENQLLQLAELVDQRVSKLVSVVGQVGDARLLVMSCLLLADEVLEKEANSTKNRSTSQIGEWDSKEIELLSDRIERIVKKLQQQYK